MARHIQEAWKPSFERLLKESRSLGIGLKHMLTTVGQYDAPVLQKLFLFQQAGSGHSFPQHTHRQTQSVSSAHACGVRNCQSARRQKGNQHLKTTLFNGDFTAELSCLQPSPPRIGAAWSCDTCGLVWICKQKCCTLTSICQTRQIQDVKATATCCNLLQPATWPFGKYIQCCDYAASSWFISLPTPPKWVATTFSAGHITEVGSGSMLIDLLGLKVYQLCSSSYKEL